MDETADYVREVTESPQSAGQVIQIRDGRLELSIGSDDGLREGHPIHVWRADKYLGRAKIIRTTPDRSVAELIANERYGEVEAGDRVGTKLQVQ
jgi:hypothetical protein